jgi:small nuclear ribonucleoprotein
MVMEPSKKPLNVLVKQTNAYVVVTLKNGVEYRGRMVKCDGRMNLLLENAEQRVNDKPVANYGDVLVRGNNILYITLEPEKE